MGKLDSEELARKNKFRKLSSYSWIIIVTGVLFIITLWLFCWEQVEYEHTRAIRETSRETMNLCIAFEEHVRRILADADEDLLVLKNAYEREGISSPTIDDNVKNAAKDPARFQVAVSNEQGILIKSFNTIALGMDVSDREYFHIQQYSATDALHIGQTLKARRAGSYVIPLSRRINNPDGSFAGIVYIGLKPDYFCSFYRKMNLGQDQLISLVGLDWIVRARQEGDTYEIGKDLYGSTLWKKVQDGHKAGSFITNAAPDLKRLISYRVMPDYPFVLTVGKSVQVALTETNKRKCSYILTASLFSLLITAFCYVLIRRAEHKLTLNAELLRLDQLNIVGEMAAGIGHEVRNPLTTVRGYLQMFLRKEKFTEYHEQLTTMIEELDRANSIITEFLSLAKNKSVEMTCGNLNEIINTLFPLLQADAFRLGHQLEAKTAAIPDIEIDPKEIKQLILNLTRNGLEAMNANGKLTIQTYLENDEVVLAIQDTGPGIPAEIKNKLGTPFVTTKENGTGLGLPVCYRIAQRHNAYIDIRTSSEGTAFLVKFRTDSNA